MLKGKASSAMNMKQLSCRNGARTWWLIVTLAVTIEYSTWSYSIIPFSSRASSSTRSALFVSEPHAESKVKRIQRIDETTRSLLYPEEVGIWSEEQFQEAKALVEVYARRQNRRSAIVIERLLRRVVEERIAGNDNASELDMAAMYTSAIQGWAYSGEKGSAQRSEEILDYMQFYYERGDVWLKPQISAFNAVLTAYAQSQQNDAAQQTLRFLQKMIDWNTNGRTDVAPNKESYAAVLRALAKAGGKDAPALVYKHLAHMEKISQEGFPSVKPDYVCRNVYLSALSDAVTLGSLEGAQGARRAQDYLNQMLSSTDKDDWPDVWSFNLVINAWSKSGSWELVERAEALVAQLEAYHVSCNYSEKTRPNTNTFNCLIACYGRSTARDKAQRARAVLNRMKLFAEKGINPAATPDTVTYNSVMK